MRTIGFACSLTVCFGVAALCAAQGQGSRADQLAAFRTELSAFRRNSAGWSPDKQAQEWLHLFDLQAPLIPQSNGDTVFDFTLVMDSMPGPAAWPEFDRLVKARPIKGKASEEVLLTRLLADALVGDFKDEYSTLQSQLRLTQGSDESSQSALIFGYKWLAEANGDREALLQATLWDARSFRRSGGIALPPVVPVLGERRAREYLSKLIVQTRLEPTDSPPDEFQTDPATLALCRKLTWQLLPQLKYAQWPIAEQTHDAKLILAMHKRFPASRDDYDAPAAVQFAESELLVDDIVAGKTHQAAARLLERRGYPFSTEPLFDIDELDESPRNEALYRFLREMVREHPKLPLWQPYVEAAYATGHIREMTRVVANGLAHGYIRDRRRHQVLDMLWKAQMETGHIDAGAATIRLLLHRGSADYLGSGIESASDLSARWVRLANLLGKPDWLREAKLVESSVGDSRGVPSVRPAVPDDDSGAREWAGAYDRAFLWSMAVDRYRRFVALNPQAVPARLRLAKLEAMLGDRSGSEADYRAAYVVMATRLPRDAGRPLRDEAFDNSIELPIARKVFSAAAKRHPNSASAHFWLGQADWSSGRSSEARSELVLARKLAPNAPSILQSLTVMDKQELGRPGETDDMAVAMARKHENQDNPEVPSVRDLKRYWAALPPVPLNRANLPLSGQVDSEMDKGCPGYALSHTAGLWAILNMEDSLTGAARAAAR